MRNLTDKEIELVDLLGECWNKALALPVLHGQDFQELSHAIHNAQNIILARPAMEFLQQEPLRIGSRDVCMLCGEYIVLENTNEWEHIHLKISHQATSAHYMLNSHSNWMRK